MGGIVSRLSPDIALDHGLNDSLNRLKNTFDRTPKYKIIDDKNIDPRSATLEINRTPLCLLDIVEEEGHSTPIARPRKKSKRRSTSRNFQVLPSQSFEFVSGEEANVEPHLVPWEPRAVQHEVEVDSSTNGVDDKYDTVVEELRKCLSKTTMKPVYVDQENKGTPGKIVSPNTTPANKELKKKLICFTDNSGALTPVKKERTPLSTVNSNLISNRLNPSVLWRGDKIWRSPGEERSKLQVENTPPTLPPFGSPCSAPPASRFRHIALKQ